MERGPTYLGKRARLVGGRMSIIKHKQRGGIVLSKETTFHVIFWYTNHDKISLWFITILFIATRGRHINEIPPHVGYVPSTTPFTEFQVNRDQFLLTKLNLTKIGQVIPVVKLPPYRPISMLRPKRNLHNEATIDSTTTQIIAAYRTSNHRLSIEI